MVCDLCQWLPVLRRIALIPYFTVGMVVIYSSEMLVTALKTTQCWNPEDDNPYFHFHENLNCNDTVVVIVIV